MAFASSKDSRMRSSRNEPVSRPRFSSKRSRIRSVWDSWNEKPGTGASPRGAFDFSTTYCLHYSRSGEKSLRREGVHPSSGAFMHSRPALDPEERALHVVSILLQDKRHLSL